MKTALRTCRTAAFTLVSLLFSFAGFAQTSSKSLLINHGGVGCGNASPEQHFFSSAVTTAPALLHSGNAGIPFYGVFSAYNPADHKVYFADIGSGGTKVYALDYNFGGALSSPVASAPTYTYGYTLNQLCFDNHGNNYGFYNFNGSTGTAVIGKVDIATGAEVPGTQRTVQFPADHIPNTVGDGDIVILPNGRMFATFGNAPSTLYELSNPNNAGTVTATYLASLPRVCFSIAYVDGNLVMAGSDGGGCYYFIWDINSVALSSAYAFPVGKTSADMSNMTVAIGATKQLVGVHSTNGNTAQVYYRIVVKNRGNISLNNIQVSDDLAAVFGTGNVLGVQVQMLSNPGNLQLNPAFNGTTDANLLLPGQSLENYPVASDSVVLGLMVTATNLVANQVYNNSAVASGSIGAGAAYLAVSDSSNNGSAPRMDLDGNGVSDDAGENVPTPFVFTPNLLPVKGLALQATKQGESVKLAWTVPSSEEFTAYEVERGADGKSFTKLSNVPSQNAAAYDYNDNNGPKASVVYYRVKGLKTDKSVAYSNAVFVKASGSLTINAYPNPFASSVTVQVQTATKGTATIFVKDVAGRTVVTKTTSVEKGTNAIALSELQRAQKGIYFVETVCGGERNVMQVTKQ